ncbi:MAG: hypothetical protein OEY22_11065 [Candidatus Bathyarchaeota archaeon]|nr:hypothetical protein [Candidatus Bathyarchaeota archaeon]
MAVSFLRVSEFPYKNFDYNIRRAEALVRLDGYLEDFLYNEGKKTIGPFIEISKEFVESFGMNRIMKRVAEALKGEIEVEVEKKGKEHYEEIGKQATRRLRPLLLKAKKMLEDLGILMDQILLEQAIVAAASAFEAYLKELIVSVVALNPKVRKRFSPEINERLTASLLYEYGQDAKRAQAEIVADMVKLDVSKIKSLLDRLLHMENVFVDRKTELKISKIFAVRNIIIHQAGFTDPRFKKMTKSRSSIDKQITLTRRYVLNSIGAFKQLAGRVEGYVHREGK